MVDQFDGDVALQLSYDGGEIEFSGGQPVMDAGGLETAVLISLFTAPGWWGNALDENEPDNQIGSGFEPEITGQAITIQRLRKIKNEAELALEWMKNISIAKDIFVTVTAPELNTIFIDILITKKESEIINIRYELGWVNGFLYPVNAKKD